jgi:predicted PurR-regulated permease PerM
VLNPVVMSHTVKISPLTVLISVLVGAELGAWVGGLFGGFIGVLLAVPLAATIHVLVREIWTSTAPATIQLD